VSTSHGAVFYLERATLVLENMKVDEYSATAYKKRGEIIYATASEITLRNTQITGIFTGAVTDYGAIYLREETATGAPSVLNIISSSLSCTETGEVEKGGWITAGKNTFVNMVDSHISGGAAQLGGNVYIGGSAKMTMTESTITGGTATAGGDLYLLGSVQVDAQSQIGDGSFYAGEKADLDATVGAMVADIATGNAVWYRNITDAVAAYTAGSYMKLFEAAELALATDAVIDINGLNVAVAGQGETKITAYDTANKDYATFGSLTLEGAVLVNDFVYETADGTNYYTLSQASGYSFHVLDMGITGVALRTTTGGIYFKGVWNCDETLKAQIASFGVAVSLRGMPGTDFAQSEDCLYTAFAGEELICGAEMTGVMIDGIVKKDREPALNDGYGRNYAVCATAYVTFKSGETVVSDDAATEADDVAVTLYSVVNGIESLITELEATNVEENKLLAAKYLQLMDAFYADWKDYGLESWGREDFT
ncbi:MAG: hypothetical protein IKU07_01885, partial [Oscillospiraceae bacterium]|nr:hypothetical protein [Oscillospiraceae bacterium]